MGSAQQPKVKQRQMRRRVEPKQGAKGECWRKWQTFRNSVQGSYGQRRDWKCYPCIWSSEEDGVCLSTWLSKKNIIRNKEGSFHCHTSPLSTNDANPNIRHEIGERGLPISPKDRTWSLSSRLFSGVHFLGGFLVQPFPTNSTAIKLDIDYPKCIPEGNNWHSKKKKKKNGSMSNNTGEHSSG